MAPPISQLYTAGIRRELSYLATWMPDAPIGLGDIGKLDGKRFIRQGAMQEALGLPLGGVLREPAADKTWRSSGAVTVTPSASAKVPDPFSGVAAAKVHFDVSFSNENAILLDMHGCVIASIDDQIELQRQVQAKWEEEAWNPEWCVVTEVIDAKAATVLMAGGREASASFAASAAIGVSEGAPLAGVGLKVVRTSEKKLGLEVLAAQEVTPLFKGLRLKKRFWSRKPKEVIEGIEPLPGESAPLLGEHESLFDLLGEDEE